VSVDKFHSGASHEYKPRGKEPGTRSGVVLQGIHSSLEVSYSLRIALFIDNFSKQLIILAS